MMKCQLCGEEARDKDEEEFIDEVGMCYDCDHNSVFDELSQEEYDKYLDKIIEEL